MKSVIQFVAVGAALMLSAAAANAKPAYVASTVNLRAAPGTSSEIVDKIPGGSLVDAGDCSEGWCAVTWQGKSGFAIQTSLDMSGRVPRQTARAQGPDDGYVRVPGPYADGPVYYEAPGPYYYGPGPYYYGPGPYYGRYWGYHRHW